MSEFENNYTEPVAAPEVSVPATPISAPAVQMFYPTPPAPKPPKQKKAGPIIALVLCCSVLSGTLSAGGLLLAQHLNGQSEQPGKSNSTLQQLSTEDTSATSGGPQTEPTAPTTDKSDASNTLQGDRENSFIDITQIDTSRIMTPAEVYALNVGSTVGITTSITTSNFWGIPTTSAASGSGFIYSDDGYILTNFHVIEDSDSITVSMYNGDDYKAKLVGYDESNDIAVLKIDAEGLTPVIMGDSDNLNVGDTVLAIGNPLGELTFSLTGGIISAKSREVSFSNGVTMDLLQTDCAINSGNSGGALFNLYGEVIGITNAKYSSSSGSASIDNIGFAIPWNSIRDIVNSIIENGYISKPYIGVSISDVSQELQYYGLPAGAAVQGIERGSPAEDAGLKTGDIIIKAGDTDISGSEQFVDLIAQCQIGQELELMVYRRGQNVQITITIEE